MHFESFAPYLGHSLMNDDFEERFVHSGLKLQPSGGDPTIFSKSADEGFVLGFNSSPAFEEFFPFAPKTPGAYILVSIYGEPGKSELPFGLDWEISLDQLQSRLGEPKKILAANATFLHDGLHVVCRFRDKTMQRMQSATLSLVDVYALQRYGLQSNG